MDEKAKILIVEDERIIALEMRHKLESMGYDVSAIVSSGEEAVRKAEELHPDLVLMDIILQGEMDGVEAAGQIRTRFNIPVVYVTANVSDDRMEGIKRSEPFGCVFKPFEDVELRAAIDIALYRYKMEAKLRKSEKGYRALFENAGEAIYVVQDDRIKLANPKARELYGYSQEEITSRPFTDFIHEEEREMVLERHMQRLKGKKPTDTYPFRIIDKSGDIRWVELNSVEFSWEDRPAILCFHKDITDRKRAEETLKKSEERFRTIIESMEDGYYEVDLAGELTFFNEAMRRMTGFPVEELMGMSNLKYTRPETGKKLFKTFHEVYRTGTPADVKDYEIIIGDGTTRILELNASLIRDEKDRPAGFRGITRDVTKRKEMENALRKSEERYRLVAENAADVIWVRDMKLRLDYISPSVFGLMGYTPEEFMDMTLDGYMTSASLELCYKAFEEELALEASGKADPARTRTLELEHVRKDGSVIWVEMKLSAMRDRDGRWTGTLGVSRNITGRKEAEEEIKSHQEHIELINQILRHDLTNDLVVIQSALNLYNNSPEEELLQEISSRTKKSLGLINRMRELEFFISRHSNLKPHKINDIIDEVIKNYPSIDFKVKGKCHVMADDSLSSVIDNIVRNAVIHGNADRITITTGKERDMCEVRIADNGTGIPDEIKAKVFEEGFIHGDTGNTGLGLHIVEKAMESYGGYVYVEDNEPEGTVIVLRFRMVK
ncbi:MAG: PAS domain S-box protein [Thermodesulfobacteriota bacterium]|nr:PAS domain S-box protein [Thermodesulfobacteriota bacterium]